MMQTSPSPYQYFVDVDIAAASFTIHARRLVALCVAIYSAPFWQMLRDRGQLSNEEAADAAAWALEVMLTAAKHSSHESLTQESSIKEI